MVEALRHAPGTSLGVPPALRFGEVRYQRPRIALGRIELVLQIPNIKCYIHAPYYGVWK